MGLKREQNHTETDFGSKWENHRDGGRRGKRLTKAQETKKRRKNAAYGLSSLFNELHLFGSK